MERDNILRLTPAEVKAALDRGDPVLLVDVRKPSVYARGHIARAICLPLTEFEAGMSELPAETFLVFY